MPFIASMESNGGSDASQDSRSMGSDDSYDSHSTSPSSLYTCESKSLVGRDGPSHAVGSRENVSPGTSLYPRSSVDTYASTDASDDGLEDMDEDDVGFSSMDYEYDQEIPPLPVYRREIVEPNVRPSTPHDFGSLFPSLNRLSIRHDEFTPDGNMNLRVDVPVPGRRRTGAVQLFHLRMYDLAKRDFSLRRYCRDSGREVCNSKRKYTEPASEGRPGLQRSMTSAIKTLAVGGVKPQFRRRNSGGSLFGRPGTSHSSCDGDDELASTSSRFRRFSFDGKHHQQQKAVRPRPTNSIKLEFSNYARVDVSRRGRGGAKRYEFQWWGHRYSWKRVAEKHLGTVSFHLLRDGATASPLAHIVPEARSPNQILVEEHAGGWVPPCHMYISDENVLNAMTDVADVIMATGLMALVDDCIKERWQTKKVHRIPVPLSSKAVEYIGPKAFVQHVFGRRHSASQHHYNHHQPSPLRWTGRTLDAQPIPAC